MVIAPLAALNRGFSKKCMSSIGVGVRTSHTKNAIKITAPTANAVRISGLVQPCDGASITPQSSDVMPAMDKPAPTGSSLGADGSFDSGTRK